jgi:hypothetical protein
MHKISNDILSLQAQLTGQTFDTQKLEQSIIQAFKGDLTHWDVSHVSNANRAFSNATAFNQDIGSWDVSRMFST